MASKTQTIVYPVGQQPASTITLNLDDGQPVTVVVQTSYAGVLLSSVTAPLAPGGTAMTVNGVVLSFAAAPAEIIYFPVPKTDADKPSGQSANTASSTVIASTSTATVTAANTNAPTISASTTITGIPSYPLPAASVSASVTSSPPRASSNNAGLAAGAVAGVAIGALVAGALIAGLVLWFCWRRKRSPKLQYSGANTYAIASQEKGFSTNTVPLTGVGHAAAGLGGGLPQPLEDKAISGDISKISNAIKNHVQSYYHTSRISPVLINYDDLHALGPNLPISVGTLTTLMGNTATREIALRFIIAWVVVSRLQPSKDPSKSLLPSEVAQCYQTISTGDRGFQGTSLNEKVYVQFLIFA
jgi:hypothetical protein